MFDNEAKKATAMRKIGSDIIPTVVLRFDPVLFPSMFGAKVEDSGGFPWIKPWKTVEEIRKMKLPPLDSGIIPLVVDAIDYFKRNKPDDFVICTPPELAPLDQAISMFGSEIFTLFYEDPGLIHELLDILTRNFIQVSRYFKHLLNEPQNEKVSFLGTYMPGIRVAADSIVNLSPDMITDFINPTFELMAEELGQVLVHYCPSPGEKYYHVIEPLINCKGVLGIDQSGGVEYLMSRDNPSRMVINTTMVADAAFVRKESSGPIACDPTNINPINPIVWSDIRRWLGNEYFQLSKQRRRGLILRAKVESVNEGEELFGLWHEIQASST
ncbi:MAG TPA: uroporphyrinogen decarboxylase family protein [archaeon]|nr:uroporphyrinogen decarboxylase family protein [archaeon]